MIREGFFLRVTFFLLLFFANAALVEGQESKGGASVQAGVPKGQAEGVDPLKAIPEPPNFRYNSLGRRDPFLSFVKPSEVPTKGMPPLQQAAISSLKFVGVAWGAGGYGAMIQVADGKSYPVRKGTRIGPNQGRIKDIGPKEIVIEEPYLNIFGRSDLKQVVMKLYNKKEGVE